MKMNPALQYVKELQTTDDIKKSCADAFHWRMDRVLRNKSGAADVLFGENRVG